jgi:hypothetical protein
VCVVRGDPRDVEAVEGAAEGVPLAQDRQPRQARLEGLQRQELEQRRVTTQRPAPLAVVVVEHLRIPE